MSRGARPAPPGYPVRMSAERRDYERVARGLEPSGAPAERMERVVDALWEAFRDRGMSWVGFYLHRPEKPEDRRLVLGPHRDRPACSPIGMHGVCGAAIRTGLTQIVADVHALGGAYIACDPRDRSEIVVPLGTVPGAPGVPGAVLDVDSEEEAAFSQADDAGLRAVLEAAGLLERAP